MVGASARVVGVMVKMVMQKIIACTRRAPSPLTGDATRLSPVGSGGEGECCLREHGCSFDHPLTLTLSREGRGDRSQRRQLGART